MRHATLVELAERNGVRLPEALLTDWPPVLSVADERGWFRFQRLYDAARTVLQTEADLRRVVLEAAIDDAADGSGWLELQIDPSGYAARFDGLCALTELVLDAAAQAGRETGVGVAIVVAANRTRHELDARTLARLAARYADRGVVGFGLSNDERRGTAARFSPAFRIARRAGLASLPHGGELAGPDSVLSCVLELGADRVGHGIRAVEDPATLDLLAERGVACEVCPASNVALGVYPALADVPVRRLLRAGVPVALGADDPLLFGSRLADQYEIARHVHGLGDAELAELVRASVRASRAPESVRAQLLAGIENWLATDPDRMATGPVSPVRG